MASGADDSGVPGSGDSDQAVEANGASRWADWTLNRVLVVAGVVLVVLVPPVFCVSQPFSVRSRPPPPLSRVRVSGGGVLWVRSRGSGVGRGARARVAASQISR